MFSAKKENKESIFGVDGTGKKCKHWDILFDKGYAGVQQDVPGIIPKKKRLRANFVKLEKEKEREDIGGHNRCQKLVWKNGYTTGSTFQTI